MKATSTRTVISVLTAAKRQSVVLWNELDVTVTEAANEATNNVQFFSSFEKYTELLSALDPRECCEIILGMITGVSLLHTISRCCRSPHRISRLLKDVTNQMIDTRCRSIEEEAPFHGQTESKVMRGNV
jgi:hypothetical protein